MDNLINNKREEVKRQLQELLDKTKEFKDNTIEENISSEQQKDLNELKDLMMDLTDYMEEIVKNTKKLKDHEDSFDEYMNNVRNDINKNK